jgi:hypothetical protein
MNQLYASAVGTAVLQSKEIPPRPADYDAWICLFAPGKEVDEAAVRAAFGEVLAVTDRRPDRMEIAVRFATHAVALSAIKQVTECMLEAAERDVAAAEQHAANKTEAEVARKARDDARRVRDDAREAWDDAGQPAHLSALDAARIIHLCKGIGTLYTDRPYDRRGW